MLDETETDRVLASALEAIDRATLSLHLSYHVAALAERIQQARQARDTYMAVLAELEEVKTSVPESAVWQEWYDEAESGRRTAAERVADLDG